MSGPHDHRDGRGVFVELWVLDLVDHDYPTALLLSQLLWWHQPAKDGRPKLQVERDGHRWLLRADDEWWADARLTTKQVRRARQILAKLGLVVCRRFKRNGAPTSAWRPDYDALAAAADPKCPNPEVPPEGQFHGTTPGGPVGTTPGGSLPLPIETVNETTEINQMPAPPSPAKPNGEHTEAAKAIVNAWWEAQDPRPVNEYMGVVKVVATFLAAGHAPNRVAYALADASCPTKNALLVELNRDRRPSGRPPLPPALVEAWRAYAQAEVAPRFTGATR